MLSAKHLDENITEKSQSKQSGIGAEKDAEKIIRLEREVKLLKEYIRLILTKKYGAKSEQLSDEQLSLLELEPSVCDAEVATEAAVTEAPAKVATKPVKKPVRGPLPANLPRREKVIHCPESQCHCSQCGARKKLVGYESSERLGMKPREFFVEITKREKLACGKCEELGVAVAAVPATIIEKGILADSLVIDLVINKYCDHLPLYRQSMGIKRDTGMDVSQSTMGSAVMGVGTICGMISEAMKKELLGGGYVQADETTVPVQSGRTKGKNWKGWMWEYGHPLGPVIYDFRMGREREGPKLFLAGYEGRLQSDGYAAYNQLSGTKLIYFGCWAHARRKFFEASKADPTDAKSVRMVKKIGELYAVEIEARDRGLDEKMRATLRGERSRPLLEELKAMIIEVKGQVLPQSGLGKACTYAINQWERLVRYVEPEHGMVEIDNNWAENGMRGVALGRKNWIHIGSEESGTKIAAILSVLETCKRLQINAREYLADVLPQLVFASTRPKVVCRPADLTPRAWALVRAAKAEPKDEEKAKPG